jgi:hypothetical protein
MVKRELRSIPTIDLGAIVRMGRGARVFDDPNNQDTTDWHAWARKESRRRYVRLDPDLFRWYTVLLMPYRLGLVLFAFDAFISVLHDGSPHVLADELAMKFPSPEFLFMASSEAEWMQGWCESRTIVSTYTVSLTLAALLCDTTDTLQLPRTLMGRFVLLHGKHCLRSPPARPCLDGSRRLRKFQTD